MHLEQLKSIVSPSFVANKVKFISDCDDLCTVQYLQCLVNVIPYKDSSKVHFTMDIKRLKSVVKPLAHCYL